MRRRARRNAVDPAQNVVLEASAGTGKTRVLVERYVNLLRAGVEPDHILAITFTRKAAAEMRQRIIDRLKEASRLSEFDAARWRDLKERLGDIADLDDRRVLPLAAARVSARGRRRSRASTSRTTPRCRGWSPSRSTRRCGSAAASRATTTTWRWCSRSWASGGCAAASRRCSIGGSWRRRRCAGFSQKRAARLTAATACARGRGAAGRRLRRRPRRPRRVPARRSASATRSSRCWRTTCGGCCSGSASRNPQRAHVRRPRAKSRRRFARWSIGCARTSSRRTAGRAATGSPAPGSRRPLRQPGRLEAAPRDRGRGSRRASPRRSARSAAT